MTSVNVTTQKNTVTVQQGDATTVTVTTQGAQGATGATGAGISAGDKGALTVAANLTDWTLNDSVVTNANVSASAAIAGTKISPNFGSQNIFTAGNFAITSASPSINLNDTDDNPDYRLANSNGLFKIRDTTNGIDRFKINASGVVTITGGLAVTDYISVAGNANISGNLTVSGTTTTIDSTTLTVEDKNIELGKVGSPTDITADGGGITLLGDTNHTFNWLNATDSWTSSEHISLPDNKRLRLGGSTGDFQIYHGGTHSILNNFTGDLISRLTGIDTIRCYQSNKSVGLFFNGSQKAQTSSDGFQIQDNLTISGTNPQLIFDQTSFNNKYKIEESSGQLKVKISNNGGTTYHNSITIGGVGNIFIPDNDELIFGTGQDLSIVHDGTDSKITNKTGNLLIEAKDSETGIKVIPDGSVELYHDNAKKFSTQNYGCLITGTMAATSNVRCQSDTHKITAGVGNDLTLFHDSTDSFIENTNGNLHIRPKASEEGIKLIPDGSVELYHDNVKRCETSANGLDVTGTLKAINKVNIHDNGTSTPMLQLTNSLTGTATEDGFRIGYSTNSNVAFFIASESNSAFQIKTGGSAANDERLNISNTGVFTVKSNSENMLVATPNANVQLFHNGVLAAQTVASGLNVIGTAIKLRNTANNQDLVKIFHSGDATGNTLIAGQVGDIKIQPNEDGGQVRLFETTSSTTTQRLMTTNNGIDINGDIRGSSGILFNNDTADANTLDDYEEGTWTPTVLSEGNIGTPQYTCTYTKIGRLVTINADIHQLSDTTSSTFIAIGGMPYVPSGTDGNWSTVCHGERYGGENIIVAFLQYGGSGPWRISFQFGVPSGHYSNVRHSDISDDGSDNNLRFTLTYEVA